MNLPDYPGNDAEWRRFTRRLAILCIAAAVLSVAGFLTLDHCDRDVTCQSWMMKRFGG